MKIGDIFKNKDEKEKDDPIESLNQKIDEIAAIGRKCLSHPDFQKYRKEYEIALEKTVTALLNVREADPQKKLLIMEAYIERIKICKSLLSTVMNDVKKGERHVKTK